EKILQNHPDFSKENASDIVRAEVGKVFEQVLLDAGVFKRNETGRQAFNRFVYTLTEGGVI
ncbi:MAG: galactose-1-phosphate uridylyltransferase, partial [Ruminococcus sp.]